MTDLSKLEPQLLWAHFACILKVPRPSRHEEQVRVLIEDWAQQRGFSHQRDDYGNLVVKVPASAGYEKAPVVILQGHLDMVCERSPGSHFDFLNDEFRFQIDMDWVRAVETTLGADNGIGVAAALAIADDERAIHGPLELLFTVEEELGLKGALHLDGALLSGRILLNLDSEDPAFYVGCAGASATLGRFRPNLIQDIPQGNLLEISVSGLQGGHSGLSILDNPGNAIKILASVLGSIRVHGINFGILEIEGGSSRNAIPREARAKLWVAEASRTALKAVVAQTASLFREDFADREKNFQLDCLESATEPSRGVWQNQDADRIVDTLLACPHGVLAMSRSMDGLVETSNNLATITSSAGEVVVATLARSSSHMALQSVSDQVSALFRLAGATVEVESGYPGWQPDLNSPLLLQAKGVYKRLFGDWPEVRAIHAGLECGVIGTRISGVDAISFGPTIEGAHTPDERVRTGSVADFYRVLTMLLAQLALPFAGASQT